MIIINGKKYEIPGIKTKSWVDDSKTKYVTDKDKRERAIRAIVCHTHKGERGKVIPGIGPDTTIDEKLALYQVVTDRYVSWDYTIDGNGDITCQNDPAVDYTWQATTVNPFTLGFEMIQVHNNGDLYESELDSAVLLIDFLTYTLGIQRQIPWNKKKNEPNLKQIKRLLDGGTDVVGIYGHVNQTANRGEGDPGPGIFIKLKEAGYELFDYDKEEDLNTWKERQKNLGFQEKDCDGIALSKTRNKMIELGIGNKNGLWVSRPIDNLIKEIK